MLFFLLDSPRNVSRISGILEVLPVPPPQSHRIPFLNASYSFPKSRFAYWLDRGRNAEPVGKTSRIAPVFPFSAPTTVTMYLTRGAAKARDDAIVSSLHSTHVPCLLRKAAACCVCVHRS
jgi:hypothetical protein